MGKKGRKEGRMKGRKEDTEKEEGMKEIRWRNRWKKEEIYKNGKEIRERSGNGKREGLEEGMEGKGKAWRKGGENQEKMRPCERSMIYRKRIYWSNNSVFPLSSPPLPSPPDHLPSTPFPSPYHWPLFSTYHPLSPSHLGHESGEVYGWVRKGKEREGGKGKRRGKKWCLWLAISLIVSFNSEFPSLPSPSSFTSFPLPPSVILFLLSP